jgi:hypothetical protein
VYGSGCDRSRRQTVEWRTVVATDRPSRAVCH